MKFSTIYLASASILSILIGVFFYFLHLHSIAGFMKALDGILLLSSICLGFYSACLSVFASMFNTKIVRELMEEKDYRNEFIVIASSSLVIGFLTVVSTIVFQVMIENNGVSENVLNVTNGIWGFFVTLFFSLQLIFVFISFLIFFSNSEENEEESVYTPPIK